MEALLWTGLSLWNMHFVMMMRKGMDTAQKEEAVIDLQTGGTIAGGLQVLMAEGVRGAALTMEEAGRGAARTMAGVVTEVALIITVVQVRKGATKVMRGAAPLTTTTVNAVKPALAMIGPAVAHLRGTRENEVAPHDACAAPSCFRSMDALLLCTELLMLSL